VLVSPIDGEGSQVIWFVGESDDEGLCRFVGFSINDHEGIRQVYGHVDVPVDTLPERRMQGHIHNVALQAGSQDGDSASDGAAPSPGLLLHMLETDFDYGRRLVREGQAQNARQDRPVPVEYRLFGPWLWLYDDAQVGASRWQSLGSHDLTGSSVRGDLTRMLGPAGMAGSMGSLAETAVLLSHPAFRGWFAYGEQVFQYATTALRKTPLILGSDMRGDPSALARIYFDRTMVSRLRRRLTTMSEWLWRAGDVRSAELAMRASETLATTSPAEHPFTRRMIELGLRAAGEQLRRM
jgi:hypothetical protein